MSTERFKTDIGSAVNEGLVQIAEAVTDLADAVREMNRL